MKVWREFTIDAAHDLSDIVPPEHKCAHIHGHTYRIRITATGPVVNSMVVDYSELKRVFMDRVHSKLDHKNINAVVSPSTSENVAVWIAGEMSAGGIPVSEVSVQETASAGAVWSWDDE